ncbi:hypothetical protein Tco_0663821 [Tanacetum coccineum]
MLVDESLPDVVIQIELEPIAVQLAYLLGSKLESVSAYTDLIKRNMPDELSNAVALNTLLALKGLKDASNGLKITLIRVSIKLTFEHYLSNGLKK